MGQKPRAVRRFPGPILSFLAVLVSLSCSGREHAGPSGSARPAGTLVVSYRNEPRSFNRYAVPQSATELFTRLTQAPLVRLNRATREPEPWLAAGWKVSEDAKTWTLKLRPNIKFSDGTPLDAEAVKFNFERHADPSKHSPNLSLVQTIESMRVVDPLTLEITLKAPNAAFDHALASRCSLESSTHVDFGAVDQRDARVRIKQVRRHSNTSRSGVGGC